MHFDEVHRFTLTIPDPFDFVRTVAKPAGWHWATPREVFRDGVLWTGIFVGGEPVGLKLSSVSKNTVKVAVFAGSNLPGGDLDLLESEVRSGLGADEDLAGFYRFARDDRVLSVTVDDLYGMRIGMFDDLFGDTILAILLQMAPMTRSDRMMDDVLEHYGTRIEFDGNMITLWPRAEEIARVDPEDLREKAKLGYRAERLVKAAQYLTEHPLSLRKLAVLPEEDAVRQLTGIPGIGPYSAGIILGQTSLPVDAWSVVVLSELFLGETPKHPRQAIEGVIARLTARWGRWRWFAFVYVANDLENLAKIYPLSRIT